MQSTILKITVSNELDIVLAYKRAAQLCEYTGMNVAAQTKFATAVSEICRNVLEHVGEGTIQFNLMDDTSLFLEAVITDKGRGIGNLEDILAGRNVTRNKKGMGIINSRKLVDYFSIKSHADEGTRVILRKKISDKLSYISKATIQKWKEIFANELHVSPYEELKKQNMQTIEVMETLRLRNLENERLNKELNDFAAIVSHDLKAPLRNLEGLIHAIKENIKEGNTSEFNMLSDMLEEQTRRMDSLIQDILSYSTLGKQSVQKNMVNVGMLIREVVALLTIPADFTIHIGKGLPVIYTEEVFLNQIFSNLISNAVKYHDQKSGSIRIECSNKDNMLLFSVEDDGPGIAKEYQQKIFDLFESTGKPKESSGIGLTIITNILKNKDASIWVESEGRGSKFLFTWPDTEQNT